MKPKNIAKLKAKILLLREKRGIKSSELESLASALGKVRHKRGKEPTWVDLEHPKLNPLSIPHHSKELNRFTAQAILDQLENDLEIIESLYSNK